ncbi:GDP-mannose 4,6-dehydratase [Paenibacillus radicis (ex Gao et al. 2016)]|uniref:GDP-mannose 4,6-dehydratase n=1 Tax=Paenibacillus radicis (ex Gao et al. 2016) TaxID=1737354 RepID=A0A917H092_9BACL|nr:GDP-mannose 4,6-dehydratase [Paenibacillus radicis (ex Gao et al. 2016)]GGG63309.1 GDP-mannose 4,6-dehydratase [Paenibacillus radicis (ex Gao et al. 2016)]
MRALITGVSGFVGTFLCEKLLANNYEVFGLSRTQPHNKSITFYSCDITDSLKVEQVIDDVRPDEIYHLAGSAFIPFSYNNPSETYNTIVNGTMILYEALRKLKIDAKILYVGSAAVYGDGKSIPVKEEDLLHPNNPYAGAKACADIISEQYVRTYGMKIIRARSFNHTGPNQSSNYVCSNFAKQISEMEHNDRNIIRVGNINVKRDFLDVRDVVSAYYLLMKHGKVGEAYNVSSNKAVAISEILNLLISNSELINPKIEVDTSKLRKNDTFVRLGDNTKLKVDTGWSPVYDLNETMKDLLHYWREISSKL